MKLIERDTHGRFAVGNPGGPGRPPIEKERLYVETLATSCSVDDWQKICERAVEDARDGNYRAREWLSKYLLGEHEYAAQVLHAHFNDETESRENPYANAPVEELIAARAAMDMLNRSCGIV